MPKRNKADSKFECIVGALLRRRRHEAGITRDEMALKAKTNTRTVSDAEKGFIHLKVGMLADMCQVLDITITSVIQEAEQILVNDWPIPAIQSVPCKTKQPCIGVGNPYSGLPSWLTGTALEGASHAASADELRRRDHQRDLEDSPELCEADQG